MDDWPLLDDEAIARRHAMLVDIAEQLCQELALASMDAAAGRAAESTSIDVDAENLAAALAGVPRLLEHLHGMVLEWQASRRLQDRLGCDPVLSHVWQAWIGSPGTDTAAAAVKLLAAQADFCRQQQRMRTPLSELPAEVLHDTLLTLRDDSGAHASAHALAEARIRRRYHESTTRLGLIGRLVASLGGEAAAALTLVQAGVAVFVTALALLGGEQRESCLLALMPGQGLRLGSMLQAAGADPATVQETLSVVAASDLAPWHDLPEPIGQAERDGATGLLAAAGPNFRSAPTVPANRHAESPASRAITDGDDRLLSADDPLALLQLRCGGVIPGAIAVPHLAQLLGKARRLGLRMAGSMSARDGQHAMRAWVEIEPLGLGDSDGEEHCGRGSASETGSEQGCAMTMRHWHRVELTAEDPVGWCRRTATDRLQAELWARLDDRQRLLAADGEAADLIELVAAMRRALGRRWTDFVSIRGEDHGLPVRRPSLDGAALEIAGSRRRWRASLVPHSGPGGEIAGFDLYFMAETPLIEDNGSAGTPLDLVDAEPMFGRGLAPVLRQPIARIIANAETIRLRLAGPLEAQYTGFAADIAAAGEHLLALVEDLAELEAIEADDFSTVIEAIDLADVARRAAAILSGRARSKRIAIVVTPNDASLPARADLRRVLQVLLNLIGNALHYAPEQTRITIELAAVAGRARVTVADQGPGLSPDQQSRLFGKFERLGRSGGGGSGLGLYISRRLARAMGGDVIVASAAGQGARFSLSLPSG